MNFFELEARQIAEGFQGSKPNLEQTIADLEAKLANKKAELERVNTAMDRLRSYTVHTDGVHKCPRCWIVKEVTADLTPVSNDGGDDKFRCARCRDEFIVPA